MGKRPRRPPGRGRCGRKDAQQRGRGRGHKEGIGGAGTSTRHASRVCPASGKDARDVKEWDHAGPVFGDGLLRGHRKGQAVSEKGGGARTKLPGRWPVTAAAGRVDEPFVPAGHRGTTLGGGDKIDPRGLREWRKPRREMLMEDSQACLALLRFVDVVYLTNSRP